MVTSVAGLAAAAEPGLWWCAQPLAPSASPWGAVEAVDAELGTLLERANDAMVVLTSTRLLHADAFSSFVGVRPPCGMRLSTLPTHTTVAGVVTWIVRQLSDSTPLSTPLPPPVSHQLDVTLAAADTPVSDPLGCKTLWIRAVVPRPGRCTDVVATLRFGLRDLVSDTTRWDAATDSERSQMATEHAVWPTPDVDVCMHDAHGANGGHEDPEAVLADAAVRAAALALFGPTVDVTVPPSLWLRPPLPREASAAVRGEQRSLWLPWALLRRLPDDLPAAPCVAWVPEEREANVVVAETCPSEWEPTGETATYVCADHVVHAMVVRRGGRADVKSAERPALRGRAREPGRRPHVGPLEVKKQVLLHSHRR